MSTLQAWYRDDSDENLDQLHQTNPPRFLTKEELFQKSGVRYRRIQNCDDESELENLTIDGNYKHSDWMDISRDSLPDFDDWAKKFYSEHLHKDDEVRLVTAGSGYFEIRDYQDHWIRIHLTKGDLIHLPAGIYHRLVLDSGERAKMFRLFKEISQWEAISRPDGDSHPIREQYLKRGCQTLTDNWMKSH